MSRRTASAAAAVAAAAAFLWTPGRLVDMRIGTSCARVLASGGDPYARDMIIEGVTYPCLYPPLALHVFRPAAALSDLRPGLGERAWRAFQVLAFAAMLALWRTRFLGPGRDGARLAFALLAFGGPLWVELRSGNVAALEQLLLWAAFALYADGRDGAFAGTVALAAQIKLQPAAFLAALLRPRPRRILLLAGAAATAALFALNELVHPGLLESFRIRLADTTEGWRYERGPNNCSALAFLQHVLETAGAERMTAVAWARRLFAPWAALVAAGTWAALRRVRAAAVDERAERRAVVLLACAAYALLAPRFKDYSYYLLIPSALAAVESDAPLAARAAIVVLAVLNSAKGLAAPLLGPWALLAGYFKLYAAVLVWGVLLTQAGRSRTLNTWNKTP